MLIMTQYGRLLKILILTSTDGKLHINLDVKLKVVTQLLAPTYTYLIKR